MDGISVSRKMAPLIGFFTAIVCLFNAYAEEFNAQAEEPSWLILPRDQQGTAGIVFGDSGYQIRVGPASTVTNQSTMIFESERFLFETGIVYIIPGLYVGLTSLTKPFPLPGKQLTVQGGIEIIKPEGTNTTPTELFFSDDGQIRSHDNNHRIIFHRNSNVLELLEYGEIKFSPGATAGESTSKVVIAADGTVTINGDARIAGTLTVNDTGQVSDARIKDDLGPMVDALERILRLDGRNFSWKQSARGSSGDIGSHQQRVPQDFGLFAQAVEDVFPEVVGEDKTGLKYIQYQKLVVPLIEAVKTQQIQLAALQDSVRILRAELESVRLSRGQVTHLDQLKEQK